MNKQPMDKQEHVVSDNVDCELVNNDEGNKQHGGGHVQDSSKTRHVRFQTQVDIVSYPTETTTTTTTNSNNDLWWSKQDFQSIASVAKGICREVRLHSILRSGFDSAYRTILETVQAKKNNNTTEENNELAPFEVQKLVQSLASAPHSPLAKWSLHGHSCRGLERGGSRLYARHRDSVVQQHVATILKQQHVKSSHELGVFSRQSSQSLCILARALGQADAAAAVWVDRVAAFSYTAVIAKRQQQQQQLEQHTNDKNTRHTQFLTHYNQQYPVNPLSNNDINNNNGKIILTTRKRRNSNIIRMPTKPTFCNANNTTKTKRNLTKQNTSTTIPTTKSSPPFPAAQRQCRVP